MTRTTLSAATAALSVLALAAPASAAEKPRETIYHATIDCGAGPVKVASSDDLFAPLVHRPTGRRYHPVAWNVVAGDKVIAKRKKGASAARAIECSYEDHVVVGTVTVKKKRR